MKPNEKAVVSFSCVKKDDVRRAPRRSRPRSRWWALRRRRRKSQSSTGRNDELTPDTRKKGGVK
jgi:hypothetical protein